MCAMKIRGDSNVFCTHVLLVVLFSQKQLLCQNIYTLPVDCSVTRDLLLCKTSIPTHIPAGIIRVHITAYDSCTPIEIPNDINQWQAVEEFDIALRPDGHMFKIEDYTFKNLKKVKSLGIHGLNIDSLGKYVFTGLEHLEILDLSGCVMLGFDTYIMPALFAGNLSSLTALSLSGVQSAFSSIEKKFIVFNSDTFKLINQLAITNLTLIHTFVRYHLADDIKLPQLKYLDVSAIALDAIHSPPSNISNILFGDYRLPYIFQNLNTLIASNNTKYGVLLPSKYIHESLSDCKYLQKIWWKIENMFVDNVIPHPFEMENYTLDVAHCHSTINLRRLSMKYNNLVNINGTFNLPANNIQEIDFSDNQIVYISPYFMQSFLRLKVLLIANNALDRMQIKSDFAKILLPLFDLEELSIAGNRLTFIPYEMFKSTLNIKVIDISNNKLEALDIKLQHLVKLQQLNLKNNKLKSLSYRFCLDVTQLKRLKNSTSENTQSDNGLDLDGNQLECCCETKAFVQCIVNYNKGRECKPYTCNLGGTTTVINQKALHQVEYICIRPTVIIVSVTGSCGIATAIVVGIVWLVYKARRRKRRDLRQRYLNALLKGDLHHNDTQVKFMTFLSHSSADADIATDTIYKELNTALNHISGVDMSLICVGDMHFRLGFSVIEQSIKCLEESCVVICVVSKSFCQSEWCLLEIREAYERQKPIILVFLERVDESEMSPVLLSAFRQNVRASLYKRDDRWELEPSWQQLADSVLTLASMHH